MKTINTSNFNSQNIEVIVQNTLIDHTSLKIDKIPGEDDDFLEDQSPIKDDMDKVYNSPKNQDDVVTIDAEEEKSFSSVQGDNKLDTEYTKLVNASNSMQLRTMDSIDLTRKRSSDIHDRESLDDVLQEDEDVEMSTTIDDSKQEEDHPKANEELMDISND